jgi:hypothetical protein
VHILIVTFELLDRDSGAYQELCEQFAPAFAALPGLITKQWLANAETNTYGGVYTFEHEDALKGYLASDLFANLGQHPNFTNISVKSFGTIESAGVITGGAIFAKAA